MDNLDDYKKIVSASELLQRAKILQQLNDQPLEFQVIRFPIVYATARLETDPYKLAFQFRSYWVMATSHPGLIVKMKPNTMDSYQSPIELRDQATLSFSNPVANAFFHWDAQSLSSGSSEAQYMDVVFSMSAEIKSGSFADPPLGTKTNIYQNFTCGPTAVTATTATPLTLGPLTTNNSSLCQWIADDATSPLYIGDSGVDGPGGTEIGIAIQHGESFRWTNRRVVYGYSASAGNVVVLREF